MNIMDINKFGIYAIKNKITNRVYVGSTKVSFKIRWNLHRNQLKTKKHNNIYLQRSWEKYGEENFDFIILEIIKNLDILIEREQFWIDFYKNILYNLTFTAVPNLGIHMSEESKQKISKSKEGTICSEETKQKISKSNTGKHRSEESKKRMSNARQGMKFSEQHKQHISESKLGENHPNFDKTLSDKTKEKIRQGNLGKIISDETKEKMRQSKKGKIRQGNLGKIISDESKEKMRQSKKGKSWTEARRKSEETKHKYTYKNKLK